MSLSGDKGVAQFKKSVKTEHPSLDASSNLADACGPSRSRVYDPPAEPQTRPTCGSNEATCANGQCISRSKVCDGNFDCTDGSDERSCSKFLFSGEVSYFYTFLGKKI